MLINKCINMSSVTSAVLIGIGVLSATFLNFFEVVNTLIVMAGIFGLLAFGATLIVQGDCEPVPEHEVAADEIFSARMHTIMMTTFSWFAVLLAFNGVTDADAVWIDYPFWIIFGILVPLIIAYCGVDELQRSVDAYASFAPNEVPTFWTNQDAERWALNLIVVPVIGQVVGQVLRMLFSRRQKLALAN